MSPRPATALARRLRRLLLLGGLLTGMSAVPGSAQTVAVVTSCGTVQGTGQGLSLAAAMAASDSIAFDCPDPAIVVRSRLAIASTLDIDGSNGGHPIQFLDESTTLLASGHRRPDWVFSIEPGGGLRLRNASIEGSLPSPGGVGILVRAGGFLLADGVSFDALDTALEALGPARVSSSSFTANDVAVTLAQGEGDVVVESSRFASNVTAVLDTGEPRLPGYERLVTTSLFDRNQVAVAGCPAADCQPGDWLTVANSLIRGSDAGHAAVTGGQVALVNATVKDNLGTGVSAPAGMTIKLENTIVAGNAEGNCAGTIDADGHSIQWPGATCGPGATSASPGLSPLYEPPVGSPAYATGDRLTCILPPVGDVDLFGQHRPRGLSCSIGAVEGVLNSPPVLPPNPDR